MVNKRKRRYGPLWYPMVPYGKTHVYPMVPYGFALMQQHKHIYFFMYTNMQRSAHNLSHLCLRSASSRCHCRDGCI